MASQTWTARWAAQMAARLGGLTPHLVRVDEGTERGEQGARRRGLAPTLATTPASVQTLEPISTRPISMTPLAVALLVALLMPPLPTPPQLTPPWWALARQI